MMNSDQPEYNVIDIAKFVCALLVVAIHVPPLGVNDSELCVLSNYVIQNWLTRIAVPFFFVASGFFFFRKTDFENFNFVNTKKYVYRLMTLYFIWSIIYFPLNGYIFEEEGLVNGTFRYCRNFIFTGSYTHLWYFPSLIFAIVIVSYLICRKVKLAYILIVAIVLYLLGLLAQSWFGLIEPLRSSSPLIWKILKLIQKLIVTTRDGLFEGFLFVGMGALFAYRGFNMSVKKAICGFVISYILMLFEVAFVYSHNFCRLNDMYFFLVPSTFFAFGMMVNCRMPSDSNVFKTLRKLSSLIFFAHLWVRTFVSTIFEAIGISIQETCFWFILTVIGSVLLSYSIIKLAETRRFGWIRKIY